MKLETMSTDECLKLANDINEYDITHNPKSLSTWVYDPKMSMNCECFTIVIEDNVVAGFCVLKDMGIANGYCLWISLHPSFRYGTVGYRATKLILGHAFIINSADMVLSEVFESNEKSIKIHGALFELRDEKRHLNGDIVYQYGMSRDRYFANLDKFR